MGGRDLDRFSRFAFGTFDNRLHGYPSALVRYDRGARAAHGGGLVGRQGAAGSMASRIRPRCTIPDLVPDFVTTPVSILPATQLADLIITVGYYQLVCDFLNIFHVTTGGEGQPA